MSDWRKKLRIKEFNALVFTMCLFLSAVFWLLTQLSDSQKTYTPFTVEYVNTPKDFVLTNELPNTINLELESQGFQLLKYELSPSNNLIKIDLSKVKFRGNDLDKKGILLNNLNIAGLENQLKNQVEIKSVSPDTLFFNISRFKKKKMALKPRVTVDLGEGFDLVNIKVIPDSAVISGSYHYFLDNKDVKFVIDSLPEFSDSLTYMADLDLGVGVDLEEEKVNVLLRKENVLKQNITVPVQVINLPSSINLQLFPNKVSVSFYSSNTVKKRLSSSAFNFIVDYNEIKDNETANRINVQPYLIPQNVQNVKVSPGKLEFIKKND